MTKKNSDELRVNKIYYRAKVEVADFEALLYRFERNISILGRGESSLCCHHNHSSEALKNKKAGENLLFQISSSRTITP